MKLYKDTAGEVYAYEADGSQDEIIPKEYTRITKTEADALRKPAQQYSNTMSSLDMFNRFTSAEQTAIVTETLINVPLKIFYDRMMAANYVDVTNVETVAGVDALIALKLIQPSRKIELLSLVAL